MISDFVQSCFPLQLHTQIASGQQVRALCRAESAALPNLWWPCSLGIGEILLLQVPLSSEGPCLVCKLSWDLGLILHDAFSPFVCVCLFVLWFVLSGWKVSEFRIIPLCCCEYNGLLHSFRPSISSAMWMITKPSSVWGHLFSNVLFLSRWMMTNTSECSEIEL